MKAAPKTMLVEYWRRRYQRINTESFVAANVMALITHTVVSLGIQ